jgi:hypothetical protein
MGVQVVLGEEGSDIEVGAVVVEALASVASGLSHVFSDHCGDLRENVTQDGMRVG